MKLFPPGMPPLKRIFDLVLTLPGLVILSPVMAIVAVAIWLTEGRPVMFHQQRPGYKGRIFTLSKFRTMRHATDRNGKPLADRHRLTALGRFLRSLSLDELPELFNVLKGEMSLVGPRPLLVEYLERYSPEQMRRHDVYPGITGWAQIHGRNAVSWQEKFRLDVWYVDHWSLWLDIKILYLTIGKVFKREGVSQPGQTTTQYFMGNEPDDNLDLKEIP